MDSKGNPEPDTNLRDYENVPLTEDIHDYFAREVLPHVPDAWLDESRTQRGYEIRVIKSEKYLRKIKCVSNVRRITYES